MHIEFCLMTRKNKFFFLSSLQIPCLNAKILLTLQSENVNRHLYKSPFIL